MATFKNIGRVDEVYEDLHPESCWEEFAFDYLYDEDLTDEERAHLINAAYNLISDAYSDVLAPYGVWVTPEGQAYRNMDAPVVPSRTFKPDEYWGLRIELDKRIESVRELLWERYDSWHQA